MYHAAGRVAPDAVATMTLRGDSDRAFATENLAALETVGAPRSCKRRYVSVSSAAATTRVT